MPDYMILICESDADQQRMSPAETKALVEGHSAYAKHLETAGAYADRVRFRPACEGKRVRAGTVAPGPFGEDRTLAGYYLVKADNLDAAVALAALCPMAPGDTLDVRPVMKGSVGTDKGNRRGKTFAFAVLGNAASEPAWIEVMDRIDAETHDGFPDDRFVGGVRLEAPGSGRQIVARGPQRIVLDGPFLESKEVIGGVFFMRIADVDEAACWASGTRFMNHGALEIRELWRS